MKKNRLKFFIFFFVLFSCQPKLNSEDEIFDQTKVEQITDPWEVDVVYHDSIFFLNKDLKALIQGYKKDSLLFEEFNTKIIYNGRSMMGNGANSKRMFSYADGLMVIQSSPHQLTKLDFQGNKSSKLPIRLKNTVEVFDGFLLSEDKLGLVSYPSLEKPNQLELLAYDLKSNTASILYEKESLYPANTHLIRTNSSAIFILSPYDQEFIILDRQGKLRENVKLHPAQFSLEYKQPYPFSTPDDYFRLSPEEQLASRSDQVYDFYYTQGKLYLLLRRLSLSQDRVVSKSELVHVDLSSGQASVHSGQFIFLSFDQRGNVFQYRKESDSYWINIFPLKELK
ncbi:hypothetical protein Aconfl_09540 [Algoriphagus confluentis]|uniref:DUF4221 domain-containing protein n=1 Tax=Algoriphagus confluentis TaxID=1697556 RepID=A0ABQ6PK29_9BACT|nr:hypothetical protein Aconfl_09540 [Algoriphagus confluentis]